ncbi:MAG: ribonuclease E/G [Ignavibacteriae bacterium HGW-Ignavibacteriae-4]|nr:MAG: ribonuclease E/G [Ignavibacteriae bacterium HGW-Ignavibacteriae-4]
MNKKILINSTINEVRIAITEDKQLAEYFIDLPDKEKLLGNIYLGRVNRVVQGLNAAFISIGQKQDAFLHFSDIDESLESDVEIEDDETEDEPETETLSKAVDKSHKTDDEISTDVALRKTHAIKRNVTSEATFSTKSSGNIQINLEEGQDILVQVTREAYGTKGVKVTSKVSLPGRYVVFLPFEEWIGVSKKINSHKERSRLRKLARNTLPKGSGCIIRTAAHGKTDDELKEDWDSLITTWKEVEQKVELSKPPTLLYQDMHLTSSIIRDLFTKDVTEVIIDSKKLYNEIIIYLKKKSPALLDKVTYYKGKKSLFDEYGVERDIAKTFRRTVHLKSGASFAIDQTEAMVVIDINSGRSVDKDQEGTALKTNMEVLKEVARHIRLRDLAGIILIDFIDMKNPANRKKVYYAMNKELERDRAKTVTYPLTKLGLLQITRQRINQNISEKVSDLCPTCGGSGKITSKSVLLNQIERWLKNFRANTKEFRLELVVHPDIADYMTQGTLSRLSKLMIKYFVKINIKQADSMSISQFQFHSLKKQKDITSEYMNGA